MTFIRNIFKSRKRKAVLIFNDLVLPVGLADRRMFMTCIDRIALSRRKIDYGKPGSDVTATVNDIAENPHNIKFVELEAAQVARVVNEVEYVVLNGNYALEAGYSVGKDSIAYEKSDSVAAKTYVNIIGVYQGNENSDKIKALVSVLRSDDIKKFITDKYDGAVIFFEK